jgi:hypothetical protein
LRPFINHPLVEWPTSICALLVFQGSAGALTDGLSERYAVVLAELLATSGIASEPFCDPDGFGKIAQRPGWMPGTPALADTGALGRLFSFSRQLNSKI